MTAGIQDIAPGNPEGNNISGTAEEFSVDEFRRISDRLPQMAWLIGANGELIHTNRAFHVYTGIWEVLSKEELWQKTIHPDDLEQFIVRRRAGTASRSTFEIEVRIKRAKDNTYRWNLITLEPQFDKYGNIFGWIANGTDIHMDRSTIEKVFHESQKLKADLEEKHLELSEAQRTARIGSWFWDLHNDQMSWSDEMFRILGISKETSKPTVENFLSHVVPEDLDRVRSVIDETIKSNGQFDIELSIIRASDGERRTLRCKGRVSPTTNGERPSVLTGVSQDITEIKEATYLLQSERDLLDSIINRTVDGVFVLDRNYRYTLWNNKMETFSGFAAKDALGKAVYDLYPKEVWERWKEIADKVFAGENAIIPQSRYVNREGFFSATFVPIRKPNNEISGCLGIVHDITDLLNKEEEIRKSRDYYLSILDESPMLIWRSDKEANINYFNKTWLNYTGRTLEEEIGFGWTAVIHPDDLQFCLDTFLGAFKTLEPYVMEYRLRRVDGTYGWIVEYGRPLYDQDGNFEGYLGSCLDIDMRKKAEEELRQKNKELQRSNEELEQFAYVASHDLKEPLRMVTNYTQLLLTRYNETMDQDGREFLKFASEGALRMGHLIHDLLEFSRIGKDLPPRQLVDANETIRNILQYMNPTISEANISLEVEELPPFMGYPHYATLLFQNLLENAIKFRRAEGASIQIGSLINENKEQVYFVKDNGIGIAKEHHDRIFEIFKRLHDRSKYEGTGMGLAICKKIVEVLGGRIWVESAPGHGSTFYFTIPQEMVK